MKGTVYLRHTYGDRFEQRFSIRIPQDAPEGSFLLRVSDGTSSRDWDRARAPGKYRARTMKDLIRILSYEDRNDHLVLELLLPEAGLTVEGQELPVLPGSVMTILQASRQTGQTNYVRGSTIAREQTKMNTVLAGSQTMALKIARRGR